MSLVRRLVLSPTLRKLTTNVPRLPASFSFDDRVVSLKYLTVVHRLQCKCKCDDIHQYTAVNRIAANRRRLNGREWARTHAHCIVQLLGSPALRWPSVDCVVIVGGYVYVCVSWTKLSIKSQHKKTENKTS